MHANEGNKKCNFSPKLVHSSKACNLKLICGNIYHFDVLVVWTCKVRLWNINITLSISFHKETHIFYTIYIFESNFLILILWIQSSRPEKSYTYKLCIALYLNPQCFNVAKCQWTLIRKPDNKVLLWATTASEIRLQSTNLG